MRHCSLRPSGERRPRPVERCDASVALAVRNCVPQWCGTRGPAEYEEFRTAFAQYQAAIEEAFATEFQVSVPRSRAALAWGGEDAGGWLLACGGRARRDCAVSLVRSNVAFETSHRGNPPSPEPDVIGGAPRACAPHIPPRVTPITFR